MNDIFKDMQAKVGCEYISDLPSYKRKVWQEMKRLNPADYEEKQLEDFSKYVFGMSYQSLKDVMKQQKGREEQYHINAGRSATSMVATDSVFLFKGQSETWLSFPFRNLRKELKELEKD